jgi:hypothetical protein
MTAAGSAPASVAERTLLLYDDDDDGGCVVVVGSDEGDREDVVALESFRGRSEEEDDS